MTLSHFTHNALWASAICSDDRILKVIQQPEDKFRFLCLFKTKELLSAEMKKQQSVPSTGECFPWCLIVFTAYCFVL